MAGLVGPAEGRSRRRQLIRAGPVRTRQTEAKGCVTHP